MAVSKKGLMIWGTIIVFVLLLGAYGLMYYEYRTDTEKTIKRDAYMATSLIYMVVAESYWDHVNYSHGQNISEQDVQYEGKSMITLLNFSISVLKNVSKKCDSVGWTHMGLDINIKAYIELRNFLLKNWGNYKKVIPVTKYIKDNFSIAFVLFFSDDDAECCFDYNYDTSQVIKEGLKHAQ
ncbi:MAG: hypothetical protein GXO25_06320 [Euryarchaeota archaeon]|nr:hypothetical protein [Euryarchaeota archaeon]